MKAGFTRLRRRRWSSPFTCRMLRRISSSSGPSGTSNISAIFMPGKVAARVRRKNAAASRSSTKKPIGEVASQRAPGQLGHTCVEALALQVGVEEVELGQLQLGDEAHAFGNRNPAALASTADTDELPLSPQDRDARRRRRAARPRPAPLPRARHALRARHAARAALPRRHRAGDRRHGLLLGRRADSGRRPACTPPPSATRPATRPTPPTRRSAAGAPATTRWCSWSSGRPRSPSTRCCGCSGRATTRPRACARATTWAPSTAPAST